MLRSRGSAAAAAVGLKLRAGDGGCSGSCFSSCLRSCSCWI